MTARARRSWGYQFYIGTMGHQFPGKSSRGAGLFSPLRLCQQHNELFERTGAGATQSKTPKRGSSVPFGLVPKKQKKQKHRTRHHLQHKRRNFLKTNHKQFTIHESIHTHRTRTRRTPPTEAAQNRQQQTHQYDQRTKHTELYHPQQKHNTAVSKQSMYTPSLTRAIYQS